GVAEGQSPAARPRQSVTPPRHPTLLHHTPARAAAAGGTSPGSPPHHHAPTATVAHTLVTVRQAERGDSRPPERDSSSLSARSGRGRPRRPGERQQPTNDAG